MSSVQKVRLGGGGGVAKTYTIVWFILSSTNNSNTEYQKDLIIFKPFSEFRMDYREEGGTDSNSESVGELPVETVEVSTIIVPNEILSTVEIPSNLETLEISAKNNEDSLEVPAIVETATETVTEIFLADAASFWDEFLEDCKAFENCTIYTSDGKFRY